MNRKPFSCFVALLMLMSMFSNAVGAASSTEEGAAATAAVDAGRYEVYPLPQKQTYAGTSFTITDQANLVMEQSIDEPTRNLLRRILDSKSIVYTESAAPVSTKTNIILGVKNSGGATDAYFNSKIAYDAALFSGKQDPYVLAIDKALEAKGSIALLGKDSDSVFYGLETLKMIFGQLQGKTIQSVKYEDYADSKWRGFIEGFYGFPWSYDDRKSLMRFGGDIKMNSYIFGPKDDPYHNGSWRTPYPAAELAKIKELVDVGEESKTKFVWAIHPGSINWNSYDSDLQKMLAKFEQLYGIGVRQFGLFLDDISTSQSLIDKDKHVKLVTDAANWAASKGDVKPLIYCPPFYNQAWTGNEGKPYLQAFRNVPANVEIMWTGKDVIGGVNEAENQWVKNEIGRDPYIWFNYPVNGYKKNRLLLGQVPLLTPGTHNFSGIVSNPLEQAELSKVALFGVADYAWNVDDFNAEKSWLDSFKHIAPEAPDEYRTIAYHMSDPSPNGRGVQLGESENLREKLNAFLSSYANGSTTEAQAAALITEFDSILNAIQGFKSKISNPNLQDEIAPWLNSLDFVVQADKHAVQSVMALQKGSTNTAWESLAKAANAMSESTKFTREVINAKPEVVEAGAKRLVPFATELIQKLDAKIYGSLDPEYTAAIPVSSYGSRPDLVKILDNDPSTYAYIQTKQVNGDWYGIDFGKSIIVNDIDIIQGRSDTDHDIFQRGVLEHSLDGQNWTAIGGERSGYRVAVNGLDLSARYVRYRLTHAGIPGGKPDLWTAVREFTVNKNSGKTAVYTNVAGFANTPVLSTSTSAELSGVNGVTLKPAEFIGIRLSSIEQITGLTLQRSSNAATLEFSENGVEWKAVAPGSSVYPEAAYVRLINKGTQPLTFDLTKLLLQFQKFTDPVVTHNYEGVYAGSLEALFDGKLDAKVWLKGRQTPGRYVQVDMGGVVSVQNAAVVMNDGEGDYFRQGELQLSVDGTNWESIHTFSQPGSREGNFPILEAPYRIMRVQVDNKPARYVRLYTTVDNAGWLALNEIMINEGIPRPGTVNPVISAQPAGEPGNEAGAAADRKLSTYYKPQGNGQPGSLHYKLFKNTRLGRLIILQSPSSISGAAVSIRDEAGWHPAGQLTAAYNAIDTSTYDHVLELKLEWSGGVNPAIHEVIAVPRAGNGGVVNPPGEEAAELTAPAAVAAGSAFNVTLGLRSVNTPVYAQDIMVSYDPEVMQFTEAKSLLEGNRLLEIKKDVPGTLRFISASEGPGRGIEGDKSLYEMNFLARSLTETKTGTVRITKASLGDGEGKEIEAGTDSVQVQVEPAAGPGSDGDVNGDGKVSIGDLGIIAANYGKDAASPDWQQVKRADVNGDGRIDLLDLATVARKMSE
ncbi:beta-N-acetylglucosaminidase domain-containing protein [Paenibacillus sp. SAF-054]|uniref:beta-N-acetylglucosaminidase domain-containing protein n=1 Tax=unclassified Paenibacillus TaxID=185978 RepID=UPI003F7F176A